MVDCFYVCDESVVILCGWDVSGTLDPSSLTVSSSSSLSPPLVMLVQDRDRFCVRRSMSSGRKMMLPSFVFRPLIWQARVNAMLIGVGSAIYSISAMVMGRLLIVWCGSIVDCLVWVR